MRQTRVGWSLFLVGLLGTSGAEADASGRALLRATRQLGGSSHLLSASSRQRWVTRVASRSEAYAHGLIPITERLAVARGTPSQLSTLSQTGLDLRWAPARQLWLDQARSNIGLKVAREDFGLTGQGVIVGVIDTGADLTHPAFRDAQGATRVAWLLTFDEKPLGKHAALEEEFGCNEDDSCAVYGREEIDALLEAGRSGPLDRVGHGSHVLSTAAGRDSVYSGVAPEAELVVVQSGGSTGSLSDADILLGARFVFDRATAAGQPAVLNVSLGSSFGAHDGTSSIEQGLAELAQGPGRAVVVASGNDGGLYGGGSGRYPEPFGIHTEVEVPLGTSTRVSLLTPEISKKTLTGQAYIWISSSPGDELELAFDSNKGKKTVAVQPGEAAGFRSGDLGEGSPNDYDVTVFNGDDAGQDLTVAPGNLVVVLAGTWQSGRVFDLVLTGHGTARLWVSSAGQLGPALTGTGMLVPRARTAGTVGVPASHPDLIAVGASVNRTSWVDYTGTAVDGGNEEQGHRAVFSSAGPTQLGDLKPDLLAPGQYLVAALSTAADPRGASNVQSQFASNGNCYDPTVECLVVDDLHGVSSGTSMSSPVVAGTIALLFQRDPELTMSSIRRLLRAGTRAVPGETAGGSWTGAGALDIVGTLRVQDAEAGSGSEAPSRKTSRMVLANTFAAPRTGASVSGLVVLKNSAGEPAHGFDASRLRLEVDGGTGKLGLLSAGLVDFQVSAPAGSGGEMLGIRLRFDDETIAEGELPIGLDPSRARLGFDAAGGGCSFGPARPAAPQAAWVVALLGLLAVARAGASCRQGRRVT